jgi:2-polyprenyl-3-methyl-5-hydroxy-6-metoxy-1,4-benzoquinol methylase
MTSAEPRSDVTTESGNAASDQTLYAEKADSYFDSARAEIAPLLPERFDRVLEIGCGAGATMNWLRSRRTIQYAAGVELVSEAASKASAVFDTVLTGNIETLNLPEGKFDLIVALDVLEHLVDPWSVVRRLHGALNPGGAVIVSLPNVGHYSVALPLIARGRWDYTSDGLLDRTHLRFFNRQSAIELMTSTGLVVDKIDQTQWWPSWMTKLSRSVRWYAMKAMGWFIPRHLFDYQFLIRARAMGTPETSDAPNRDATGETGDYRAGGARRPA